MQIGPFATGGGRRARVCFRLRGCDTAKTCGCFSPGPAPTGLAGPSRVRGDSQPGAGGQYIIILSNPCTTLVLVSAKAQGKITGSDDSVYFVIFRHAGKRKVIASRISALNGD